MSGAERQSGYRIEASAESAAGARLRALLRYKRVPHTWSEVDPSPLEDIGVRVLAPDAARWVDPAGVAASGPVERLADRIEADTPQPDLRIGDPVRDFLSELLSAYATDWVGRVVRFHRWQYEPDRRAAARRWAGARAVHDEADGPGADAIASRIAAAVTSSLPDRGLGPECAALFEVSLRRGVAILDTHLAARPYLFGDRPARADFALFGALLGAAMDPTASRVLRSSGPCVVAWIGRMRDPVAEGGFDGWVALEPTLAPLLEEEIGPVYLAWSRANEDADASSQAHFAVELSGTHLASPVEPAPAGRLRSLRAERAALADPSRLDALLESAGCLLPLVVSSRG